MIPRNGYNSQFPSASASLKIMGTENLLGEREQNKSEAEIPQTKNEILRGRYVVSEFWSFISLETEYFSYLYFNCLRKVKYFFYLNLGFY